MSHFLFTKIVMVGWELGN